MKFKVFYILLFSILLLLGCSGDDNQNEEVTGSDYFIRFKANGESKEYKFVINNSVPETSISGVVNFEQEIPELNAMGYQSMIAAISSAGGSVEEGEFFQFMIYTEEVINANAEYSENNTIIISSFYNDGTMTYSHETLEDSNDLSIRWTSITSTEARGQFSGTLYDENDIPLEITDGEFFVFNSSQ